ncbi:MAG: tRNA pseudouridine(55) synthase TruB [Desulfuromonadales bacterium]
MDGLLIIDKKEGMTSHDVVSCVRRLLNIRRVGHTGTLDPLATGVLPVAVGRGTRLVQFFLESGKSYRATLKFGESTDTQDSQGEILERRSVDGLSSDRIRQTVASLVGSGEQIPPMYSALKKNGVPLYKLARQGIEVEREGRLIHIDRIDIIDIDLPCMTIEVDCSKGTYIRTLCHDIGMKLGTGAHLTALRRTRTGPFDESSAVTLDTLADLVEKDKELPLLSMRDALVGWKILQVGPEGLQRLANGIPPLGEQISGAPAVDSGDLVALVDDGHLFAVARYAPEREKEQRGDFELLRVFPDGI